MTTNSACLQLLSQNGTIVIASARNPSQAEALQELKTKNPERLHIVALDVASSASVKVLLKCCIHVMASEFTNTSQNYQDLLSCSIRFRITTTSQLVASEMFAKTDWACIVN